MSKKIEIKAIRALKDNYIWVIIHTELKQCIVIDPSDSLPVFDFLKNHQVELLAVLVTHKHVDHTNGIAELKQRFPLIDVYGSCTEPIPCKTNALQEKDQLYFF